MKPIQVLALILSTFVFGASSSAAEARPNLLFFIADNWAWPHAGVLGDSTAKTPVFDRVAREGLLFSNAFIRESGKTLK